MLLILWYSIWLGEMLRIALQDFNWFSLTLGVVSIVSIGYLGAQHLRRIMRQ